MPTKTVTATHALPPDAKSPTTTPPSTTPSPNPLPLPSRPIWHGNLNLWNLLGFTLGIHFCGPYLLTFFKQPGYPMFKVHLVFATMAMYGCIWNLFHTPGHGKVYRRVHRWVGKGTLVGLVGQALTGFWVMYVERPQPWNICTVVSIGAIRTLTQVYSAYTAAKRRDFKTHAYHGHWLFWIGCLAPPSMRIPLWVGATEYPAGWVWCFFMIPMVMGELSWRATRRNSWI